MCFPNYAGARERFVEVQEVDLRWGITQDQSDRGDTLPVCLREFTEWFAEASSWAKRQGKAVIIAAAWLETSARSLLEV